MGHLGSAFRFDLTNHRPESSSQRLRSDFSFSFFFIFLVTRLVCVFVVFGPQVPARSRRPRRGSPANAVKEKKLSKNFFFKEEEAHGGENDWDFFFHFVFFVDYLSLFCNPAEKVGLMLL